MKSNFDVIKHSFFIAGIKNINYLNSNIYLITANFEKIIWDMIPLNNVSSRTKYEKNDFLNLTSPLNKIIPVCISNNNIQALK